ncbi:MAG: carboxypeptidase regulatory-like domain-containing protein [Planctomycetota bacterium]
MRTHNRLYFALGILLLGTVGAWFVVSLWSRPEASSAAPAAAVTGGPEPAPVDVQPTVAGQELAAPEISTPTAPVAQRDEVTRAPLVDSSTPITLGQGRVVDNSGQPLGGATIHIVPAPDSERYSLLDADPQAWFSTGIELASDAEGYFPVQVVRQDSGHAVIARKAGFGWDCVVLDPKTAGDQPIVLHLEPTARLRGRVVGPNGDPLRKSQVFHRWSYQWDAASEWPTAKHVYAELMREELTPDAEGCFQFCEVRREIQEVQAASPGYATAQMIDLDPDAQVKITLVPAATVLGSVTDASNHPVPGARVRTSTYGCIPETTTPWIMCKEDGSYTIDGAMSGSIGVGAWTDRDFASDRINVWVEAGGQVRVDFVLHPETTIDGRLVDSKGQGVPDMRVQILSHRTGRVKADTLTDAQGAFAVRNIIPSDTYWVWIPGNKDYGPRYLEGIPADSKDLTIRMLEAGRIWGKLGFDGEPTKDVRVRFLPRRHLGEAEGLMFDARDAQQRKSVPLDEVDGESYSHQAWAGVYDIEFRAAGYTPVLVRNVAVQPGRSPRPLDLHFELSQELTGIVLDGSTEQPVPAAQVEVLEEYYTGGWQRSPEPFSASTNAAGRFTIGSVPRRSTVLCVVADGYAQKTLRNLDAQARGEDLVVRLTRGGRIEGRVETSYSDPSSSITVMARELGREDGAMCYVDQKGRFALDHIAPGRVEVVVHDWVYEFAYIRVGPQIRQVEVREGETVHVDFDTATGVTLHGRVEGWDKPLLIEACLVESEEGEPAIAGASCTDREGGFRIPHLRRGRYRVASTVGQPGYSIAVSGEVTIGSEEPDLLVLRVPGNTVQGTVLDSAGNGIPRAVVTVAKDRAVGPALATCLTDGEGQFAIGGLEVGPHEFRARARGFATELMSGWQVPSEALLIRLQPEARLLVEIKDDTGAPLPGARVGVTHATRPGLSLADLCGHEGAVEFSGLQAYPHVVTASLEGYVPADPLIVPLREGETSGITIVLVRAGELEAIVRGENGKPLEKIPAFLFDEGGHVLGQRMTDEEGCVLFRELAPAWYEVAAGADRDVTDAAEVLPGERATVELVLAVKG